MGAGEETGNPQNAQLWLAALGVFEQKLRRQTRVWDFASLAGYLLLVFTFLIRNPKYLLPGIGGLILLIAFRLIRDRYSSRSGSGDTELALPKEMQASWEQLQNSDLARRLCEGEISGNEPRDFTPSSAHFLLPELDPADRQRIIARTVFWLDWYLGPPRRQTNKYWQMLTVFSLMPLMMFAFTITDPEHATWRIGIAVLLMFYSMTASAYAASARVAVRYLRESWQGMLAGTAETEPPQYEAVQSSRPQPASLNTADSARTRQIALVINQAQQDLNETRSGLMMIPLVPVLAAASFGLGGSWFAMLPLTFGVLLMSWRGWPGLKQYQAAIRARLDSSATAQRLLDGEYSEASIKEHVPRVLQPLLDIPTRPKGHAEELRAQIWRLAYNLDFYLDRPSLLIRPFWLCSFTQLMLGLGIPIYLASTPAGIASTALPLWLLIALQLLMLALSFPSMLYAMHAAIWVEELIAYLRSVTSAAD